MDESLNIMPTFMERKNRLDLNKVNSNFCKKINHIIIKSEFTNL